MSLELIMLSTLTAAWEPRAKRVSPQPLSAQTLAYSERRTKASCLLTRIR